MGSTIKLSILLAGAGLLFTVGTAQASESEVMNVRVPFSFVVHGETLPAGRYKIERDLSEPSVMFIRSAAKNRVATIVTTIPASGRDPAGEQPALTFTEHDGQYRLSSVWESGDEGHALVR